MLSYFNEWSWSRNPGVVRYIHCKLNVKAGIAFEPLPFRVRFVVIDADRLHARRSVNLKIASC